VKSEWENLRDKTFWIALTTVRALSPAVKADPFALSQTARDDGTYTITVLLRQAVGQLKGVLESNSGRQWYVMRTRLSDEPFFPGTGGPYLGTLSFESSVPWPEVGPRDLRRLIIETLRRED